MIKVVPWENGTGSITLSYAGQGDGPILIQSDPNNLDVSRSKILQVTAGSSHAEITINQNAKNLPYDAEIEYLQNNDSQTYIDTGIVPNNGFGFYMDIYFERPEGGGSAWLMGSSAFTAGAWGGVTISTYQTYAGGQMTWFKDNRGNIFIDPGLVSGTRMQIQSINNVYSTSLGTSKSTPYSTNSFIYGSLYLFHFHTDYTGFSGAGFRCYGCKIYDGSNVVRDFIPVRKGTTGYMYDKVSEQLFGNAGSGDFILGPDINS